MLGGDLFSTPKHALDDSALYIRRCRAQGLIII